MRALILFIGIITLTVCPSYAQVTDIQFDSNSSEFIITYFNEKGEAHKAFYIPGNLVEPKVDAVVDSKSGLLIYIYTVKNKDTAPLNIYTFSVETKAPISNPQVSDPDWFSGHFPKLNAFDWAHTEGDTIGIFPGTKEEGFAFESSGLPTIVKGYSSSLTGLFFTEENKRHEPPSAVSTVLDSLSEATKHVVFKTIGPGKFKSNISAETILDTLRSYLAFSCDTTWVTNKGICRSLQAKLDNVDKQLSKDKTKQAINGLNAFLNEVAAQRGTHITSEGYALLWFNGMELLEQLGGTR